jgi:hypothetical protein
MENASRAVADSIPAAGIFDRTQFQGRTMGKSPSSSDGRASDTPKEHSSAGERLSSGGRESTIPLGNLSSCTLRIKPDRRRNQMPIPAGRDRRRSR